MQHLLSIAEDKEAIRTLKANHHNYEHHFKHYHLKSRYACSKLDFETLKPVLHSIYIDTNAVNWPLPHTVDSILFEWRFNAQIDNCTANWI